MKLWHLYPTDKGYDSNIWSYDSNYGFVIRAKSAVAARRLASKQYGDEGGEVWLDPQMTVCTALSNEGNECIILSDYLSG